jgi:hypothetical protein
MSDVFNERTAQFKIEDVLKGVDYRGPPPTLGIAPHLSLPAGTVTDAASAARFLASHKIKVLNPLTIPQLQPVPPEDFFDMDPDFRVYLDRRPIGPDLLLPEGPARFIPKYDPSHRSANPSAQAWNQLIWQYLNNDDLDPQASSAVIIKVTDAAKTKRFGQGTAEGQLARYVDMWAVRHGLKGKTETKNLQEAGYTWDTFGSWLTETTGIKRRSLMTLLETTLPLTILPDDLPGLYNYPAAYQHQGSLTTPEGEFEVPQSGTFLPPVANGSKAGVPYEKQDKIDVIPEALAIASRFLSDVNDLIVGASTTKPYREVLERYWYLSCHAIFAKGERYDIGQWTKKTRNIFMTPFPTHLIGSMLSSPAMTNCVVNADTMDTPSLAKWSPWHGGLQRLLNKAVSAGNHAFIYADNIYVSFEVEQGHHKWVSIDLEKGEANATPQHASAVAYYLLTRVFIDMEGNPRFNPAWAVTLTQLIPALVVDSNLLIYNLQLRMPGQASGNPWTFLINHVLSSIIVDVLFDNYVATKGKGLKISDPSEQATIDRLTKKTGINMKIERVVPNLEKSMSDAIENTPTTGILQQTLPLDVSGPNLPLVDLDLLGWAAAYSTALQQFVPVLDPSRLFPSFILPKGDHQMTVVAPQMSSRTIAKMLYPIARYESLIAVGAWAFPAMHKTCEVLAENARKRVLAKFENLGLPLDQRDLLSLTEFSDPNIGSLTMTKKADHDFLVAANQGEPKQNKNLRFARVTKDLYDPDAQQLVKRTRQALTGEKRYRFMTTRDKQEVYKGNKKMEDFLLPPDDVPQEIVAITLDTQFKVTTARQAQLKNTLRDWKQAKTDEEKRSLLVKYWKDTSSAVTEAQHIYDAIFKSYSMNKDISIPKQQRIPATVASNPLVHNRWSKDALSSESPITRNARRNARRRARDRPQAPSWVQLQHGVGDPEHLPPPFDPITYPPLGVYTDELGPLPPWPTEEPEVIEEEPPLPPWPTAREEPTELHQNQGESEPPLPPWPEA